MFVITGLYFLIDKFIISTNSSQQKWNGVKTIIELLSPTKKINEYELQNEKITFIFILHDNDCQTCIAEVMEFIDLLNKKFNSQAIVLFIGNSQEKAIRTSQIISINVPTFFGDMNIYKGIIGEERIYNQIIVFDKQNVFVSRKYLPKNQISTVKQKMEFLSQY
jgi:hypothetical protein